MRIGIDLDEVVVRFIDEFIEHYKISTGKNINYQDITSFDLANHVDISKEELNIIIDNIFSSDYKDLLPFEKAIDSINHLKEKNELFFITSRPLHHKEKTESWFNNHFPHIDFNIIFASNHYIGQKIKSKADICLDNNIQLIIEDNPVYALECAEKGINVLLFSHPWNKTIAHKNLTRVSSWDQIITIITSHSANN